MEKLLKVFARAKETESIEPLLKGKHEKNLR
jgi:hypothetical protein